MKHRLIVFSLDALASTDSYIFENLPGFRFLIENGAYVKKVKGVFPSLTYPSHASIISGRMPSSTGIVNNLHLQPSRKSMDWYWYEKDIEGDTLFRAARRKSLKTSAVLWPVSARGLIDYNVAEIFPNRKWQNQIMVSLMNSSLLPLLKINKEYSHLLDGLNQPQLDNFVEAANTFILNKYKPDLSFTHFIAVDDKKHHYGCSSNEVAQAIKTYDMRIQNMLEIIKKDGIKTTFVVLSDHAQLDISKGIRLNNYFDKNGYFKKYKDGRIKSYRAIMHEAGGACYIYTDGLKQNEKDLIKKDLEDIGKKYDIFDKVYDKKEIEDFGADPDATFLISTKEGYYFDQSIGEDFFVEKPKYKATHGFDPNIEDFSAVLFMYGEGIKKGATLENSELINIAPTISKIMDLGLRGAEAKPIREILI